MVPCQIIYDCFCNTQHNPGPSWSWSHGSWIYNYLCNRCLSPLMLWVRISIRSRCTTLCDKVCQWLATGCWFSPGPPVFSTNKTDHRDIIEIFFKVALNTIKQTNKQTNKQTRHNPILYIEIYRITLKVGLIDQLLLPFRPPTYVLHQNQYHTHDIVVLFSEFR